MQSKPTSLTNCTRPVIHSPVLPQLPQSKQLNNHERLAPVYWDTVHEDDVHEVMVHHNGAMQTDCLERLLYSVHLSILRPHH